MLQVVSQVAADVLATKYAETKGIKYHMLPVTGLCRSNKPIFAVDI